MAERQETCGNCRWLDSQGAHGGFCRRHPPVLIERRYPNEITVEPMVPYVEAGLFCGEWGPVAHVHR